MIVTADGIARHGELRAAVRANQLGKVGTEDFLVHRLQARGDCANVPGSVERQVRHVVCGCSHAAQDQIEEIEVEVIVRIALQEEGIVGKLVVAVHDVCKVCRALVPTGATDVRPGDRDGRAKLLDAADELDPRLLPALLVDEERRPARHVAQLRRDPI
eukprot:CAMPEP_0180534536 /NCGR_PEP_ID=MMETSP1036_2-20121128/64233_1 /TAXON_ID=632150 /ORGANISM="Azadinium spinosum, Strain 3D9" /LENGTH=158 /DNA_ID=CAMNT_0022548867 /DNA_START=290 /DNA_END=766 /DNA_ORIENTATION=-